MQEEDSKKVNWSKYLPMIYVAMSLMALVVIGMNLYYDIYFSTSINWLKLIIPVVSLLFFVYCLIGERKSKKIK
ncbi:hypothetical protein [Carnobacterium gallinarum]|uniref:hypothetical protein n=1 Tax=Carnobacterium gallinarum TaxID=2749 RepID=UPI0005558194|nr:hypothetical protein [Carnobacterium gallinarum]